MVGKSESRVPSAMTTSASWATALPALVPVEPITQAIEVTASQGEIHLAVPEESRFELAAESRHGAVSVDVPGLDSEESTAGDSTHVAGTMGGGEAQVTLRARGDITLEAGSTSLPAEQE